MAITPLTISAALTVGYLAANAFSLHRLLRGKRKLFGFHARKFYNLNTIWFPLVLVLAAAIARMLGGEGFRLFAAACVLIAAVMFSVRIYATHIEPKRIRLRRIVVRSSRIRAPLRVVHISDMETDAVRRHEHRVARLVRSLEPDLVVHTGDLLNPIPPATYESEVPKMAEVWATIHAPLGKFTTIGEVDRPIEVQLSNGAVGGIRSLSNATVEFDLDGSTISMHSLSLSRSRGEDNVRTAVEEWVQSANGAFRLLVGHAPDYVLDVQDLPIDLCLAGHTHGGQIRIPFLGPVVTLSKVPRRLAYGFREVGNTRINVTGGVGFEHSGGAPAIRINCPPEICLIELHPAGAESLHETADAMVAAET